MVQKEIGSNFDLNPELVLKDDLKVDLKKYGMNGTDQVLCSTGRGAESFVLDEIQCRNPKTKKIALVPPFTCHTVLEPFINHGYKIIGYPIDEHMGILKDGFRECLIRSDAQVILFHRYFGFDTLQGTAKLFKEFAEKGIIFIEDKTQCIYSECEELNADYIVGSFRKWTAMPDGGYALCREGKFANEIAEYDKELEKEKMEAFYLKYNYLHKNLGDKAAFLEKFKKAEWMIDAQSVCRKISPLSEKLQANLNLINLKSIRSKNYSILYEGIQRLKKIHSLMPELGKNDVPLYFVIMTEDRDKLQQYLRDYSIYAPIVWPDSGLMANICTAAQNIYAHVLCLPIDQRYSAEDMERILKHLGEYDLLCSK